MHILTVGILVGRAAMAAWRSSIDALLRRTEAHLHLSRDDSAGEDGMSAAEAVRSARSIGGQMARTTSYKSPPTADLVEDKENAPDGQPTPAPAPAHPDKAIGGAPASAAGQRRPMSSATISLASTSLAKELAGGPGFGGGSGSADLASLGGARMSSGIKRILTTIRSDVEAQTVSMQASVESSMADLKSEGSLLLLALVACDLS